MTKDDALKPLNAGEARFPMAVGAFYRTRVRQEALLHSIDYYEEKSFLESVFLFKGEKTKILKFLDYMKLNYKE
jgi:hypothetical protein